MRKIIACCAALAIAFCMSSVPVYADDSDGLTNQQRLLYNSLVGAYDIDTGNLYRLVVAVGSNQSTNSSYSYLKDCVIIWAFTDASTCTTYRSYSQTNGSTTVSVLNYGLVFKDTYVGLAQASSYSPTSRSRFYYLGGDIWTLDFYMDSDSAGTTTVIEKTINQGTTVIHREYPSIADFSDAINGSTDSTEPSSGSVIIPDEWISGGETLPASTEPTYPSGFSPDDAFEQFEDVTYNFEDDTKSGIGFFWEFLTRIIDSLGIWSYVFFAMLFGLIVWFLKGL